MPKTEALPGSWSWDEQTLRAATHEVVELAVNHLTGLRERPVFTPVPVDLANRWHDERWDDDGAPLEQLLAEVEREILRYPFGNGHPRFHAWVNSPPDRTALLVGLLARVMNPSCAGGNHAALHIERLVIRWLTELVGLPTGSGGLLVSGGSSATLTALAAARQRHAPFDVRADGLATGPALAVFASTQAHSCVTKAVELLGIGNKNLHLVDTDDGQRMRADSLDAQLTAARERGDTPIAVVATAGTTNTGAIDPLDHLAEVCAVHHVWLHVDGAYGAPAILTGRYAAELAGLRRADSIAIDPHKWLYVPVDAGALLVREPETLRDAFSFVPAYLRVDHDANGASDAAWMSEYGVEQTRPFRALGVWAALKSTGRAGYRALIEHDLGLADHFAEQVRGHDELVLDSTGLSVVCFHRRGFDDDLQQEIARRIQLGGQSFLTTTNLSGRVVLRACFLNPLTTERDVDELIELVARTGATIEREMNDE